MIKIFYQNIRSMRGKLDQIRISAEAFTDNYDIIILTGTWLNEEIYDSEIDWVHSLYTEMTGLTRSVLEEEVFSLQ